MHHTDTTILILGGTGKTGSRVTRELLARGHDVRATSRGGTWPFDWHDPATWPAVLAGVAAVYIAYPPDLALPGASAHIHAFTRLAVAHGVRRVVLLSGRGEPQVLASEEAVRTCGAAFTILRAAWFCQNFSEGYLREPVLAGEIAFPGGDAAEPFVDADDIADVAVAALTDDAHAGQIYELTGPRLLTFADAAAALSAAAGHPVRYVPISSRAYGEVLAQHMPAEVAEFMRDLFAYLLDGHNAHVADGVQRALGRAPRDFCDYARDAAAAGAWRR